tara:strand:+ start:126 stop:992 length:867 start_codon:yes stop_codon:yes gene_type:complete
MAAGQGFKTFTTGEVLTAGDVNGYLMQGVLVFASAAARNAAITSPQEGQFAFTKDTNGLWYYDGAAWVASGATGDIEGVTAGVGITGGGTSGTVTITNDMATTITASGDIVVGTGSGTYDNLPIGTTGQILTADTTVSPYKVKWATPSAAAFNGCRVTQSAGLSLASGTSQIQLFDTEAFDTNSYHSTSTNTGRMTVPSTGYYLLSFNSSYSSNGSGLRQTGIRKNGTVIQSATLSGSSVAQTDVVLSCILSATAGDYFDLELYQNSGTTLTVYGGTQSFFSISYLGA